MRTRKIWTADEEARLTAAYPGTRTADLAVEFGCTEHKVYSKAASMGLKKSAEYLASAMACRLRRGDNVGKAYRFKPGQEAWNKGIKFDSGGRSHETRFKPGRRPHTWTPIGTERLSKEGYLERKIADTGVTRKDYVPVHRLVYEEHNGPIPEGHTIVFRDKDKTNRDPGNLECISRADLMRRNSFHNYGKDIARLIQLKGAVQRQINKRERATK